jgi:uncharacterized damage-inducible protein DinB
MRPHEMSKIAAQLAWNFPTEEDAFINGVLTGKFDFRRLGNAPATVAEAVEAYEKNHAALVVQAKGMSEKDLEGSASFFIAPKTPGDVRKMDLLWMMLMDMVHHRGQFSIYLRMAEGKVPSIYGPTADEPWM